MLATIARTVNRILGRRGAVWDGRYHARALTTPREVRHGIVYVLMNRKKHDPAATGLDPCSSARWWFQGWRKRPVVESDGFPPVVRARTWLAAVGWRRHGLIGVEERPRPVVAGRPRGRGLPRRQESVETFGPRV